MVSLSHIGEIRFRVGGEGKHLVPISQALLALERGNHAFVSQTDYSQLATPRNEERLSDTVSGPLIDDASTKNGCKAPQESQEEFFHEE